MQRLGLLSGPAISRSDMNVKLSGTSFVELPHISQNSPVVVVREKGKPSDSDAEPAYSIRLDGMHIGYIPLVKTLKEQAIKARDGLVKNNAGKWVKVGNEKEGRKVSRDKLSECERVEVVRDWLYTTIAQHHETPYGNVTCSYYDKVHGLNYDEIGDVCSISVYFDMP